MLLREEKKKALVKTSGRGLTNGKGLKNSEKNRASKIGSSSPGREGNPSGPAVVLPVALIAPWIWSRSGAVQRLGSTVLV